MSQKNVEVVRGLVGAFNGRDLATMTQSFDPDVEWVPGGPAAVERRVYRGLAQVSEGFAAAWETWELFQLDEHEVRDLGDSILWLGRNRLRGGTSRVELDQEFAVRFDLRDGRIVRFRGFLDWQEALEASGLRE